MSEFAYKKSEVAFADASWMGSVLTLITILALATGLVLMFTYDDPERGYKLGRSMFWVSLVTILLAGVLMGASYGVYFLRKSENGNGNGNGNGDNK